MKRPDGRSGKKQYDAMTASVPSLRQSISRRPKTDFCSVFLPAAGNCNNGNVNDQGNNGNYWSSTPNGSNNAYNLNFNSGNQNVNNNRNNGYSVRAVLAEHLPLHYQTRICERAISSGRLTGQRTPSPPFSIMGQQHGYETDKETTLRRPPFRLS